MTKESGRKREVDHGEGKKSCRWETADARRRGAPTTNDLGTETTTAGCLSWGVWCVCVVRGRGREREYNVCVCVSVFDRHGAKAEREFPLLRFVSFPNNDNNNVFHLLFFLFSFFLFSLPLPLQNLTLPRARMAMRAGASLDRRPRSHLLCGG